NELSSAFQRCTLIVRPPGRNVMTKLGLTFSAIIIIVAAGSYPSLAQQKTARACTDEWRANKAANQASGITEKAFVEQCRGMAAQPATATGAAPPSGTAGPAMAQKTVKACTEEWRANKDANRQAGITEKAFVARCRGNERSGQAA